MTKLALPKVAFNKSLILKSIVALAVVIVIFILGTAVGNQWQETQTKNKAAEAAEQSKQVKLAAERDKYRSELVKYKAGYDSQRLNCEKGVYVYGLLPITTKKTVKPDMVPTCGPAVI
jgi:type II secretory pathway pseudopilin PulG